MKVNDIRELYLKFFEEKNHHRLQSASLVPHNDNSLLLINSGMAPLKPYFVGAQVPPSPRVTTCQKCIRTGDIENVGQTARHGTFFEMLGNFSFNDYFKEEACALSYEFCTKILKLSTDSLYISIYEDDDEAHDIWHKNIGIPLNKIVRLGKDDNFWEVGTGPCGPCSEIYYDRGISYGCGSSNCAPGCDCDRFLEFWNLVFTQFNKEEDGTYSKLDRVNIDTGMGLERMAVIMQNVDSIFDVDTIKQIQNKVCEISHKIYGITHKDDVSIRIITDHMRSVTFMITDGILPSNEGRGYVMRRLLRRAVRHGKQLGINGSFLSKIATVIINQSKYAYNELEEKSDFILNVITQEENNFHKTLDQGMELLHKLITTGKEQNFKVISGEDTFKMYDTYGFPIELMQEILKEHGLSVDEESYKSYMQLQRTRAREARSSSNFLGNDDLVYNTLGNVFTNFVGYDTLNADAHIVEIIKGNELTNTATEGDEIAFLTDVTPIYAESGGQKADKGTLTTQNAKVDIIDCKKINGLTVHFGIVKVGKISKGDIATLKVNEEYRNTISRNHTATHLLHSALRNILGNHVEQSGTEKSYAKTRFDFSHFSSVTKEELQSIENVVNKKILQAIPVEISQKSLEQAKKDGAMALFGEKYDNEVRVVNIPSFSMELCGGTHVKNTSDIILFKIVSESSVAGGIRRIEAVTGQNAISYFNEKEATLDEVVKMLKANSDTVLTKLKSLVSENKLLKSEVDKLNSKLNTSSLNDIIKNASEVNGKTVIITRIDNLNQNALKEIGDAIKNKLQSCAIVLIGNNSNNVVIMAMATDDIVNKGFNAGAIVKQIATFTGGGGGGRPNMATAQGKDISKIDDAIKLAKEIV